MSRTDDFELLLFDFLDLLNLNLLLPDFDLEVFEDSAPNSGDIADEFDLEYVVAIDNGVGVSHELDKLFEAPFDNDGLEYADRFRVGLFCG